MDACKTHFLALSKAAVMLKVPASKRNTGTERHTSQAFEKATSLLSQASCMGFMQTKGMSMGRAWEGGFSIADLCSEFYVNVGKDGMYQTPRGLLTLLTNDHFLAFFPPQTLSLLAKAGITTPLGFTNELLLPSTRYIRTTSTTRVTFPGLNHKMSLPSTLVI